MKEPLQPLKFSRLLRLKSSASPIAISLVALTFAVLLVHGYHPGAEDGGIYAAGVYLKLHPSLFPHDAEFVRAPMAYSEFAALIARCSSLLRLGPEWLLLLAHLLTTALTLFGVQRICGTCGYARDEQIGAMALLAAWWTLPVAGTSLTIGDPYVTARSFSLPCSLLAISFALEKWRREDGRVHWWPPVLCVGFLGIAATMHRLMFAFAAVFVLLLLAQQARLYRHYLPAIVAATVLIAFALNQAAPPESAALLEAELTRQYWFLAEWRWFEVCGLLAPLVLFAARLRNERRVTARCLLLAAMTAGLLSVAVALLFAREGAASHLVARLQPLRMFMILYVLMTIELSSSLVRWARDSRRLRNRAPQRFVKAVPLSLAAVAAGCMYLVQAKTFAASHHIEVPWAQRAEPNPWIAAFAWSRQNTAEDALFAIDPTYIHQPREDAQTFRAHARRSVLPDQSKDGGEAAVDGKLAAHWDAGFRAQSGLNTLSDRERYVRLRPFGVDWLVLAAQARTELSCPYRNGAVKVCHLPAAF